MDLFHVGAGGVDHGKTAIVSCINYLRHHAVSADDYGARCCVVQGLGQANTSLGELAHHDGVVDEWPQGVDLSALPYLRRGGQRHVERALHAVAGASMGCDLDGGRVVLVGRSRGSALNVLVHG